MQTYPDDAVLMQIARGSWVAPVAVKLTTPLEWINDGGIEKFYAATRATPEEKAIVDAAFGEAHGSLSEREGAITDNRTLGDVWAIARPTESQHSDGAELIIRPRTAFRVLLTIIGALVFPFGGFMVAAIASLPRFRSGRPSLVLLLVLAALVLVIQTAGLFTWPGSARGNPGLPA